MGFWPVVEGVIRKADIIVLVFDARMPELSRNKEVERKVRSFDKQIVHAFTKIDLMTPESLKEMRKEYPEAFFVSGTQNLGIGKLRTHLQILAKKTKIEHPRIG